MALAGLAHDIRTPLTGILALAELLLASEIPERERRWAAAVKDAASHLAQLTTLVVDTARAGGADLVMRAESFSLRDLVDAVTQSLAARAEGKSLGVEISVPKSLPARVSGDALRLRSALENLIDNAVKFTERGSVTFKASAKPAPRGKILLTFAVADTGIGIVDADLKRLFRPFAQANESVARRYGGSGLGLAFVKRIAGAMGGGLTVTSQPGHGSTFRLTVQMDRAAPSGRAAIARRKRQLSLRVLCVEDNPYGRVVLNTVLGELGHHVEFAGSGEAAIAAVERGRYDIVLMDVELTGISGIEAVRRIRALPPPTGRIPVIGISGHSTESDAAAAREAGMDGYLHKPVSPRQLQEIMAETAGKSAPR
jgi:two-component system, sensor histidine kinase